MRRFGRIGLRAVRGHRTIASTNAPHDGPWLQSARMSCAVYPPVARAHSARGKVPAPKRFARSGHKAKGMGSTLQEVSERNIVGARYARGHATNAGGMRV